MISIGTVRPVSSPKKLILLAPPGQDLDIRDNTCSYTAKANCFGTPLVLLIQSGILRGRFHIEVFDCLALRLRQRQAIEAIQNTNPAVIVALTGMVSWKNDEEFFRLLFRGWQGQRPCLYVVGDVTVTAGRELLRRWEFLDGCLLDYTSRSLADCLTDGTKHPQDLLLRGDNKHSEQATPAPGEVRPKEFKYSVPDHRAFPLTKYRHPLARSSCFATVVSSLGCNMGCTFCVNSLIPLRLRQTENLYEELVYLRTLGIRELYFYDPMFTSSRRRLSEVCDILGPMGFSWFCNAHVGMLSDETIQTMKNAGCHTVMIGFDSGNDSTLHAYKRGRVSKSASIDAARMLKKAGISTMGYFLLGLPGESEKDIQNTMEFSLELGIDYASFNIYSPIAGTSLAIEALAESQDVPERLGEQLGRAKRAETVEGNVGCSTLDRLRCLAYRRFYLRPSFILQQLGLKRIPG